MSGVGQVAGGAPSLPVLVVVLLTLASVLLLPPSPAEAHRDDAAARDDAGGPAGHRGSALRRRLASLAGGARERVAAEEVLVLDGLAAALEAGLPTGQALHLALDDGEQPGRRAWSWDELRRASGEGQPLAPVWARVARRTGSPTLS
ncbi:MAG TPA: hypothetical protein VLO09_03580, partial [Ornithinimicrobium sp.]|nr:hypothetical protein [Ornithinimicrobium sp.]